MYISRRIYQHFLNIKDIFLTGKPDKVVTDLKVFLKTQDKWMRTQINRNSQDPLWRHVAMVMAQFDGLVDGYKSTADHV